MAQPVFTADSSIDANLLELCPVAEGSIVSKPLIDTGACKQVLFSLDQGQEISQHKAPFVATVHMLSGLMRFGYADKQIEMRPHDWVLLKPDEAHDLAALEASQFLLVLVKG